MALIEFKDLPDTSTPLTPDNLNHNFNELKVESGSNNNGSYVKFSDGTMICTHTVKTEEINTNYHFATANWRYPATFVETPKVIATANNWTTNMTVVKVYTYINYCGIMSLEFSLLSNTAQDLTTNVNLVAIGKWK